MFPRSTKAARRNERDAESAKGWTRVRQGLVGARREGKVDSCGSLSRFRASPMIALAGGASLRGF